MDTRTNPHSDAAPSPASPSPAGRTSATESRPPDALRGRLIEEALQHLRGLLPDEAGSPRDKGEPTLRIE